MTGSGPEGEFTKSVEIGDRFARKDIPVGKTLRRLTVTIDAVHRGSVFDSTHIAEIAFDFTDAAVTAPILATAEEAILKDVAKSKTTRDLPAQAEPALDAAYAACEANDEYSKNFKEIGAIAVTGHPWRIPYVAKHVPIGYRLQALQFLEAAVNDLVRLKDPNAIPYFETAAAGTASVSDRDWLYLEVKFLQAEQELRKSMRATVPQWGSTGMETGALMSRKEPLDIDVDSAGNIWVTDLGNNRVQRFTSAGTVDKVIGGERGIAQLWFGSKGDPYATAAVPGDGPTEFSQPMALAVGNYDVLAVIDASLKVRTFDAAGLPKAQWTIDKDAAPASGRGVGTPIITWLGDDFFIVVKDEVFTYSAMGELKKRYTLEGGAAQAAVIAAGGKLIVRHSGSNELIEYKPQDGFRQGVFSKKGVPDDGSEDWDFCTDADDNFYVTTDAGKVHKWNKRAKFLATIDAMANPRDMPRCAVSGPIIYIVAKDEIARVEQGE